VIGVGRFGSAVCRELVKVLVDAKEFIH